MLLWSQGARLGGRRTPRDGVRKDRPRRLSGFSSLFFKKKLQVLGNLRALTTPLASLIHHPLLLEHRHATQRRIPHPRIVAASNYDNLLGERNEHHIDSSICQKIDHRLRATFTYPWKSAASNTNYPSRFHVTRSPRCHHMHWEMPSLSFHHVQSSRPTHLHRL